MGDPACWLHLTCGSCGVVDEQVDDDGRCSACRTRERGENPDPDARTQTQPAPQEQPAPSPDPRQ